MLSVISFASSFRSGSSVSFSGSWIPRSVDMVTSLFLSVTVTVSGVTDMTLYGAVIL